jgi:uncharacterized protein YggE
MAFGLLATALPRPAAAAPAPTLLSVSGTGSVTLAPNVASVDAVVETNAADAGSAVEQNNARYDRIVAAVTRLGVSRADVTLAGYNVNYNPKPAILPSPPTGERYGFTVTRTFTVKVRQIGKAGSVVDACTHAGATGINGVSFGLSDRSAARAEATQKAVADARAQAAALARAAHLRIVSIKRIALGSAGSIEPQPMLRMAAAAAPTQFDQSNVTVSVTVNAVFVAAP